MNDDEKAALAWLKDENAIQRNIRVQASGKRVSAELDISGGHAALVRLLRDEAPLHRRIRDALAKSIEPHVNSLLTLQKRLRRNVGRPKKSESDPTRLAYDIHAYDVKSSEAKQKLRRRRPAPAVGAEYKEVTEIEAIKSRGKKKTESFGLKRARKDFLIAYQRIDKA
jgi:hypothetical protein